MTPRVVHLGMDDLLLIGEAVLDVPAEVLALTTHLDQAAAALHASAASIGGRDMYPEVGDQAGVLLCRLASTKPFLYGNPAVAYVAVREFVARNGCLWTPPSGDETGEATAKFVWAVFGGQVPDTEVIEWMTERIHQT